MSELFLQCLLNTSIEVQDSAIVIRQKSKSTTIPISSIQDIELEEPKGTKRGGLYIHTAKGNKSFVGFGGAAIGLGGEIRLVFLPEYLETAKAIQKYIAEYGKQNPAAPQAASVLNVADELRALKLLLDDGIITQADFDAKKKQLLNI